MKILIASFLLGVVMLGIIVYILVSLLIYYVAVDWPWIVFSAASVMTLFVGYLWISCGKTQQLNNRTKLSYIPIM